MELDINGVSRRQWVLIALLGGFAAISAGGTPAQLLGGWIAGFAVGTGLVLGYNKL